jgi:Ca2+/Na+ antiporter
MSDKVKVRYTKSFKDTNYYKFPALCLRDTLIFVGVCIFGGFVFDAVIEIVFGVVSILIIAHYLVYSVAFKYYEAVEEARKEPEEKIIHRVEGEDYDRKN